MTSGACTNACTGKQSTPADSKQFEASRLEQLVEAIGRLDEREREQLLSLLAGKPEPE